MSMIQKKFPNSKLFKGGKRAIGGYSTEAEVEKLSSEDQSSDD